MNEVGKRRAMITAIEIENFKGIGERVRVELKPLTLLFGPNSSGKSTIVQALHCAREIFERHNLDPDRTLSGGEAFDLGGFTNIVHKHDTRRSIRLRLELDLPPESLPDYQNESIGSVEEEGLDGLSEIEAMRARCHSAWVEAEVRWNEAHGVPTVRTYSVGVNNRRIAFLRVPEEQVDWEGKRFAIGAIHIDFEHSVLSGGIDRETGRHFGPLSQFGQLACELSAAPKHDELVVVGARRHRAVPSALPNWGAVLDLESLDEKTESERPNDEWQRDWLTRKLLTQLIVGPGEVARDELRKLRYLGPIREMPSRDYRPPRQADQQRWATGLGAWDRLHGASQDFLDRVNTWLSRLNCGYTVRLKHYREVEEGATLDEQQPLKSRVLLVPDGQAIDVLPNDVGIGISQLLPAVVLVLDAEGGITAIEQPEIHLHPALQAELGDLFMESALGDRKNTMILETHSEHLMLRLLRRIEETHSGELPPGKWPLPPDRVSVVFLEQIDGAVRATPLRIDETGEFIDRWPRGFFEERAGELF